MNGDIEAMRTEIRALRNEFEQFKRWTESALQQLPMPVVNLEPLETRIRNVEQRLRDIPLHNMP